MSSCAFNKCKNNQRNTSKAKGVTFHSFPKEPTLREKWTKSIQVERNDKYWIPNASSKVCSDHFQINEFWTTGKGYRKINPRAVPKYKIELNDGLPQGICINCTKLVNSTLRLRDQSHHARQILLENGFRKVSRSASKAYNTVDNSFREPVDSKRPIKKLCNDIGINISTAPAILEKDSFRSEFKSLKEEDLRVKEEFNVEFEQNVMKKCDDAVDDDGVVFDEAEDDGVVYDEAEDDGVVYDDEEGEVIMPHVKYKKTRPQCERKFNIRMTRQHTKYNTHEDKLEARRIRRRMNRAQPTQREKYEHLIEGPYDPDGPVKCSMCKKIYAGRSVFLNHVKKHFKAEYVCEQCGRQFHKKAYLETHCMRLHGAEKKLQCEHCDYKAVDRPQLTNHVRIVHTGFRPFVCDVCGADFTCKPNIRQHMRTHFAARTVQCDQCPAMFTSRSSLCNHTAKSHRLNFIYYCYLCPKTYSSRCSTRKHLARHHGIARHLQGSVSFNKWSKGMPQPERSATAP